MILTEAEGKAVKFLEKHNLWQKGWVVKFSKSRSLFGKCSHKKKIIWLSKPLVELNNEEHVTDTILHEIAHALTPGHHHNKKWKRVAIEIGCNGQRCWDNTKVIQPPHKFIGTCKTCGHIAKANARTNVACRACCDKYNIGKWDRAYLLSWSRA